MQYTYLIHSNGIYKIGKSKDPKRRLQSLKTANPHVKLVAYGDGVKEKVLHNKYDNKRINGEWFRLNNKDVENIIRSLHSGKHVEKDSNNYNDKLYHRIRFGKYKGLHVCDFTEREHINYIKWYLRASSKKGKSKQIYQNKTVKIFKWWLKQME